MTALIARTGSVVDAIDLFCGYGGSSQGIHAAGAEVRVAANHSELALECHAANYPDVDHWHADLSDSENPYVVDRRGRKIPARYIDPALLPPARFLWASPSCKFHSQANANKLYELGPQAPLFDEEFDHVQYANSERSRVTMVCPLRYAAHRHPEIVVVENVVECAQWGPGRDGSTFRWWLDEWTKIGYDHEVLFLNSAFFPPCPQSRDRMYVVFWRRGNRRPDLDHRPRGMCTSDRCSGDVVDLYQAWKPRRRSWPLERWGKYGAQYLYRCSRCDVPVEPVAWPAYSAINWSNLGPSLAERDGLGMKALAPATVERIRRGLAKFHGGPPIIIPCKAVWGSERSVMDTMSAQTTQQDKALVSAAVMANRTNARERDARTGQFPTLVGGVNSVGVSSFVVKNNGAPAEAKYRARPISEPLGTIAEHPAQAVATTGVTLPVGGNDHERPGQTRARDLSQPGFTMAATQQFGFAHVPFITEMRGGGSVKAGQHPVVEPAHTVSAGGFHHGLASPALFQKINGAPGDTAWHDVADPFNAITGRDTTGLLVLPWIDQYRSDPAAITDQLATVMARARHALASTAPLDLDRVTDDDLQAVRFRMLEPDPELRRTMAFGDRYILLGNKTQQTSGLGNAVTPPVASWITAQCLATLDDPA